MTPTNTPNRWTPLVAAALNARNLRDVEQAEAAAEEAAAAARMNEAKYEVRARVAQNGATEILGEHADGIRWSRWGASAIPVGRHPDLPPRMVLTDWPDNPSQGDARAARVLVLALTDVRIDDQMTAAEDALHRRGRFSDLAEFADALAELAREYGAEL